jgi:hypothetical protein
MHSMQKVLEFMKDNCELGTNSRFIDIGCGLGKPNFHAAQYPGVRLSLGVELEELRWKVFPDYTIIYPLSVVTKFSCDCSWRYIICITSWAMWKTDVCQEITSPRRAAAIPGKLTIQLMRTMKTMPARVTKTPQIRPAD